MKDFYEFLNHGYNFLGVLVAMVIIFQGLASIVSAACGTEGIWRKYAKKEKKSEKQKLND